VWYNRPVEPVRIGLMGLGRVGRNLFRILYQRDDLRLTTISDTTV